MVGQAIKEIRKKRGYKQTDFAKTINITQANLSLIEANKLTPSMDRVKQIASELEVPVGLLFMMSIDRDEIAEKKKAHYDIIMPSLKELILSLV